MINLERLFDGIVKSFKAPINLLLYAAMILYLIGYWCGSADISGFLVFLIVCVGANLISGIFIALTDRNQVKNFDRFYIYGNSNKGRNR